MTRWFLQSLTAGVLLGLTANLTLAADTPAATLSPKTFAKLQKLIKPGPDEDPWEQIPWLASLWQARQRAAAEGKPILLWEMDGHPLGCT